jgi:hypothetical protein
MEPRCILINSPRAPTPKPTRAAAPSTGWLRASNLPAAPRLIHMLSPTSRANIRARVLSVCRPTQGRVITKHAQKETSAAFVSDPGLARVACGARLEPEPGRRGAKPRRPAHHPRFAPKLGDRPQQAERPNGARLACVLCKTDGCPNSTDHFSKKRVIRDSALLVNHAVVFRAAEFS